MKTQDMIEQLQDLMNQGYEEVVVTQESSVSDAVYDHKDFMVKPVELYIGSVVTIDIEC